MEGETGSDEKWWREAGSDEHLRETWGVLRNRGSDEEWSEC